VQAEACALPYLVLLRAGFTVPRTVTSRAVRSYRTFSPLPIKAPRDDDRRFVFCGTFHGLAPPRCYLAPCPKEPGLSSAIKDSDCLASSGVSEPHILLHFEFEHARIHRVSLLPGSLRGNRRRLLAGQNGGELAEKNVDFD